MRSLWARSAGVVGAAALVIAGSGVAVADFVEQSVGANGVTTAALVNGSATTTITYWIEANGPCDLSVGSPATVTVKTSGGAGLVIDNPATAAVNDPTVTFTSCGTSAGKPMTLTADRAGSWPMYAESTAGINTSQNRDNYTFTVTGTANTRPTVAVGGVEDGAAYELGAVPDATCAVTDAEDGNQTKAATVSEVSGELAGQGLGQQTATCTHTDSGGLTAEPRSATYSIVDTTDPTLDGVPADQLLEATGPGGAVATWDRPTAADAGGLAEGSPRCTPSSGSTFALGTTEVTCTAADLSGNVTTGTFEVTVSDTEGPVMTGGSGATEEATGPLTRVDFTEPTAYDVVDEEVPVTCDPASGSEFAVGVHTVTCTAADGTGNPASVQLEVVVTDTTAPAIDVPDLTRVEATGPDGAVVEYAASATDLVDGPVEVTCEPASGTTFPLGSTTVTCRAGDSRGNNASETFEVEVEDTTAPQLTVPEDRFVEATGPDGAVVDFAGGVSATDAVDTDVTVTCIPESGSQLGFGPTTVNCTAVDDAGNATEKSFEVTVRDTTGPAVTVPEDIVAEATGPDGAEVEFSATASDLVDGDIEEVTCTPASGSTFALGTTTVTCSATDSRGNEGSDTFVVTVQDTTAPEITVPDDITAEATGPDGAPVDFEATATDLVDGGVEVSCTPASGTTFELGTTAVTCDARDAAGNPAEAAFRVTVQDTTEPVVTVPTGRTVEATGPDGATVDFEATATDLVDGDLPVTCDPQSGWRFVLGTTPVTCTATDAAGNTGVGFFDVLVQDTTAPELDLPGNRVVEATGPDGAVVTWSASAEDVVDGSVDVTCTPASGSTFALGTRTVDCEAADEAGNTATGSFDVTVEDTTAPVLDLPDDIATTATSAAGGTVSWQATATDLVDGDVPVTCEPASGSTFAPGATTVTCSATDDAGNVATGSFTVTVTFDWSGFFAPVDNSGVANVIKGGQSVPLKWRIGDGNGGYVSSLGVVSSVTQSKVGCSVSTGNDVVEAPTSGATSLRYDTTAQQYIYNWQSPKGANTCYRVTVALTDGTTHSALFRTK